MGLELNWITKLKEDFVPTGDIQSDTKFFLLSHGYSYTYHHSLNVALEARRIAREFGLNEKEAFTAGFLHDISAIIPNSKRIEAAIEMEINILPEEKIFPMIIHQKLSKVIAQDVFDIKNKQILSAIGCHTTLKKKYNDIDLVVFVADKIKWDQKGVPPYINSIESSLENSLEHAAFSYIDYLWKHKETLKVLHPWLEEAYYKLKNNIAKL